MPLNSPINDPLRKFLTGTLYIVATPIGNLNDITFRALETFEKVELIAAEDTRHTKKLLAHFNIKSRLVAYHEHNEEQSAKGILEKLKSGSSVALVSNAGTPTVSDPGYRLINTAIKENITVVPIPGVSAAITALSVSGLPSDRFSFIGFLPPKSRKRREWLEQLVDFASTLIFYESPRRIITVMEDMKEIFGDRYAVLSREMTKMYEEFLRGNLSELVAELKTRPAIKGEITLLVSGDKIEKPFCFEDIRHQVEEELKKGKTGVLQLARQLSKSYGVSKNMLYDKILELKSTIEQASDGDKGENANG
ncbi:MAG: 16S rRNA (cytidine(1402)-2'-O)-methyltransferase [Desulfobacteraceae bacterium]|nr:16S rRNA (cytidine(1402)-2'-O)-methyltransferase [Desulfobacteraceae bacterium]MBC2754658.1 16S rRNA (cytidine(1402)-2'-O)-methyltransferase [Desulfobacteraceae bacterium]